MAMLPQLCKPRAASGYFTIYVYFLPMESISFVKNTVTSLGNCDVISIAQAGDFILERCPPLPRCATYRNEMCLLVSHSVHVTKKQQEIQAS